MKDLGFVITLLLLFFLFWGEPDVWDRLHERVMHSLSVEQQR